MHDLEPFAGCAVARVTVQTLDAVLLAFSLSVRPAMLWPACFPGKGGARYLFVMPSP